MAMAGVDILSIGKVLGQKTISMTRRYAHLSPGHLHNAVAAIDRATNKLAQSTDTVDENGHPTEDAASVTTCIKWCRRRDLNPHVLADTGF
jgi:hypothetical protein